VLLSCATTGLATNVATADVTYQTLLDLNRVPRSADFQDRGFDC
jgi:hypothetical protein